MARSRKLGHCICDPRKACPCDLFRERDVCLCAGERLEDNGPAQAAVALTRLVKNAGCASKIPAADLSRVLARLPAVSDPRLLVGLATADDAGVFQVSPDLCLVQTVDVFAPCADDPYLFGQIAACNSLSDVYAMGGTPLTALSIIGYPIHTLRADWMYRILKGGMDKLAEADVVLVGGHSINDEEIKFGFAVTGTIAPKAVVTNAGAQPGDALILTKKIGTGIISFAAQMGRASEESVRAAGESMATLNRAAAQVMAHAGAHAATDVTGFGFLGHLFHIVRESGVTAEIWWDAVPLLPGVREYAAQGMVSGAAERNREFAAGAVEAARNVPEDAMDILYDAQTSGGLLIAVPQAAAQETLNKLQAAGCEGAAIVGRIIAKSKGRIMVRKKDGSAQRGAGTAKAEKSCCASQAPTPAPKGECCASEAEPGETPATQEAFKQFMAKAFAPGALDAGHKALTAIALSVALRCEPCLKNHLQKAHGLGLSEAKIQEAAWMGIVFGGCRAMMFWQEHSGR